MVIDDSHVLFNESDFTLDEIERRNVIAVAIIEKQRKVCKICGREGQELAEPCRAPRHGLLGVTVKGAQQRVQNRELTAAADRMISRLGLGRDEDGNARVEVCGIIDFDSLARAALGVSDK